MALNSGLNK